VELTPLIWKLGSGAMQRKIGQDVALWQCIMVKTKRETQFSEQPHTSLINSRNSATFGRKQVSETSAASWLDRGGDLGDCQGQATSNPPATPSHAMTEIHYTITLDNLRKHTLCESYSSKR